MIVVDDWLKTGSLVFQLLMFGVLLWLSMWMFLFWAKWRWGGRVNRFNHDVRQIIWKRDITWEQLKLLAATHSVESYEIRNTLNDSYRTVLLSIDDEPNIAKIKVRLDELIERYKQEEPFDELPAQIRIHLDRLKRLSDMNAPLVDDLAEQLRIFSLKAMAERRLQSRINLLSLLFGAAGVVSLVPMVMSWFSSHQ